jgi:predicted TIM-barrel fold metal-dependent hydrolase
MFESNFPVDKQWIAYVPLYNAYKRIVGDCSSSEKADLFTNTAARVYKLARPAAGGSQVIR